MWGLFASLFVGLVLLLVINLPMAPVWAKLLRIPRPYLYAGILFFASMGVYVVNGSPIDLLILLGLGALGFLLRRYGLPIAPVVIGVILGPRAEQQMRRTFQLADGSVSGLVESWFAIAGYLVIAAILLWPAVRWLSQRLRPVAA